MIISARFGHGDASASNLSSFKGQNRRELKLFRVDARHGRSLSAVRGVMRGFVLFCMPHLILHPLPRRVNPPQQQHLAIRIPSDHAPRPPRAVERRQIPSEAPVVSPRDTVAPVARRPTRLWSLGDLPLVARPHGFIEMYAPARTHSRAGLAARFRQGWRYTPIIIPAPNRGTARRCRSSGEVFRAHFPAARRVHGGSCAPAAATVDRKSVV